MLIFVLMSVLCDLFYPFVLFCLFFFNDTATTEIYTYLHTLSLHDALPIFGGDIACCHECDGNAKRQAQQRRQNRNLHAFQKRSEEHTSELQSLMRISYAVFCLKKKKLQSIKHK